MDGSSFSISDEWVTWITRNSLKGVVEADLVEVMVRRGFEEQDASLLVSEVKSSPIFKGALPSSWRSRNLEAMLNVKLELAQMRGRNFSVDKRIGLTKDHFFEQYYVENLPVVIGGLMDDWPAISKWSPDFFRDVVGEHSVNIQASRKAEPVYEVFLKGHTKTVKMREYVDMILAGGETNDYYLTANDRLLDNPDFDILKQDFFPFADYLSSDDREGKQFLWFGPKGAVSPLHRDRLNVLMTQIYGKKRIKLIPSSALHRVYNHESFFSEVDCENPDLEKYPLFENIPMAEVELNAGEALFLPVGWWHHVRAIETSINVSFTNFVFPNNFERLFSHQIGQQ